MASFKITSVSATEMNNLLGQLKAASLVGEPLYLSYNGKNIPFSDDIPLGTVKAVCNVLPNPEGNVLLSYSNVGALAAEGTAVNASKLNNQEASYYLTYANINGTPTKLSDFENDSGFITGVAWGDVSGKPSFASVAESGSYSDLINTPTIPAAQVQTDWNATTGMGVLLNKPSLAAVATSGSYSDLSGKPDITVVKKTISSVATPLKSMTWTVSGNTLTITTSTTA